MIWHLLPLPRWQSAGPGAFVPGTEDAAPFVHTSPDEPVTLAVANDRFARLAGTAGRPGARRVAAVRPGAP